MNKPQQIPFEKYTYILPHNWYTLRSDPFIPTTMMTIAPIEFEPRRSTLTNQLATSTCRRIKLINSIGFGRQMLWHHIDTSVIQHTVYKADRGGLAMRTLLIEILLEAFDCVVDVAKLGGGHVVWEAAGTGADIVIDKTWLSKWFVGDIVSTIAGANEILFLNEVGGGVQWIAAGVQIEQGCVWAWNWRRYGRWSDVRSLMGQIDS